ncbi:hypothetical protein Q5752_000361 [Cryptotrichosporon argae]
MTLNRLLNFQTFQLTATAFAIDQQLWVILGGAGFIEVLKLCDIFQPYLFPDGPASFLAPIRVGGPVTAGIWTALELGFALALSMLRIPGLKIGARQLAVLAALLVAWNGLFWFLADPSAFIPNLRLFGPTHLGEEGLLVGWLYVLKHALSRAVFGESHHLGGKHVIRLLPYSTATLNPLSVTYCIPPDSNQPLFVPILFNNSLPDSVSYNVRSLNSGRSDVISVSSSSLKRQPGRTALALTAATDDDDEDADPLSALVLRNQPLEVAKLHSVRPSESLAAVPTELSPSQALLYLTIKEPSIVSLKSVTDTRGDRFLITPHREAVAIECPSGGAFVKHGKTVKKETVTRCVGEEEVVELQARGVGPLKVAWRKKGDGKTEHGVIEGIEEESVAEDDIGIARRATTHTVPLRVSHDRTGEFSIQLTSVTDALHNTYTPAESEHIFQVLPKRSVSLSCPKPAELLVNGSSTISLRSDGPIDNALDLVYSFTSIKGEVRQDHLRVTKPHESMTVHEAGTYRLVDLDGMCAGSVLEPSSCSIALVSPPTAELDVVTLHECAQDVGVTVSFAFTGTPPFLVKWKEQRKGAREESRSQRFDALEGKLELRPEREGKHTYTFTTLGDAKYKDLPLNQPPIQQVVNPPASVDILSPTKLFLFACSGDEVHVDLELNGNDPLLLAYRIAWGTRSQEHTVSLESGKHRLTVPVPEDLKAGTGAYGKLSLVLVTVEDAKGCVKRLPPRTIEVDINRQKPTVRFAKPATNTIKDGQEIEAPLRLTGQGPWEITYEINGQPFARPITVRRPNQTLRFAREGTYRLTSVKDAHCEGTVEGGDFVIRFKPRPEVALVPHPDVVEAAGVYRHRGLCAGEEDQVALRFTGRLPFEVGYKYSLDGKTSDRVLKSAQDTGVLHLGSEQGHHSYQFTTLRDTDYENTPVFIKLEHDVHSRPTAAFVKQSTKSLCVESQLNTDAKIKLYGKAPFTLTMATRRPAAADTTKHMVAVNGYEWTPAFGEIAKDVGSYEISIVSVADASGCAEAVPDSAIRTTTLDVVETARIVPVGHDADICVGDTLDFLLQGKAPWIVEYEWNGKRHSVTSSGSRFSRYAEDKGTFKIASVALKDKHGHAQCKREVANMERRIHALPSVEIEDGSDDLREGDQPAAFAVRFKGTPPFTFTYTRSERVGARAKVVETQTVADISAHEYVLSSSQPGEYAVTSVSDKYCRYPPLSRTGK